jgi:hypothetical protein
MENFFITGTQIKSLVVTSFFRTVNNDLDIFDRDSTCIRQIILPVVSTNGMSQKNMKDRNATKNDAERKKTTKGFQ